MSVQEVLDNKRRWWVACADCTAVLSTLPAASFDTVISDPPYPEIDRDYGRMTEADWFAMMKTVVRECRRVLKPEGSAVFILQSNSEKVGRSRVWLWEFMAWAGREWNIVQDAWWWNPTAPPTVHCSRINGLMRPSVKAAVWLGNPECYRCQEKVLWRESDANAATSRSERALHYLPGGLAMRTGRCAAAADERGGVTPFNLTPIPNADSSSSGGANGHGAATPMELCDWWTRYIVPPGGKVLDPFCGSGTVGIAALRHGGSFLGIEKEEKYVATAQRRILSDAPLFNGELT